MSMIDISNVITISVIPPAAGLAPYAISNLVCFTKETPAVALTDTYALYKTASAVATQWGTGSATYAAAVAVFSQSPNILTGNGYFVVVPMLTDEVLEQAIERAQGYLYFGGCGANFTLGVTGPTGYTGATGPDLEALRAASTAQTSRKLLFLTDPNAPNGSTGLGYNIKDQSLEYSRVLYHSVSGNPEKYKWGYASRGMSTNFSGSNTTSTMHLKTLNGVSSDSGLTESILALAKTNGVDVYPNIAGVACNFSTGGNGFFDDVWNLNWFISALEVAGFNYLRQTGTKIPQTEDGMNGLKSAYATVCSQATRNGYLAPGKWTGTDTFGDPESFVRNIAEKGYYIYSLPISEQSSADRENRSAPLVQIAIKYAGAIHSSSVIVNVNK